MHLQFEVSALKISDLCEEYHRGINLDLKIIFDLTRIQERFGKRIKTVIVIDADNTTSSPSALLDLYDNDIEIFKFKDKIKAVDCYAKLSKNKRGQYRIHHGAQIGHYEKL